MFFYLYTKYIFVFFLYLHIYTFNKMLLSNILHLNYCGQVFLFSNFNKSDQRFDFSNNIYFVPRKHAVE